VDPSGLLKILPGVEINAGEALGEYAAQSWANRAFAAQQSGNTFEMHFSNTMGTLASLWTPETSDLTYSVLKWTGMSTIAFRASSFLSSKGTSNSKIMIDWGKQGKHIPGHNNYKADTGRSILTHKDPQSLLSKGVGRGEQVGNLRVGLPGSKERVNFGEVVGVWKSIDGKMSRVTTNGVIHFGKDSAHIVPSRPNPWRLISN
jgi:filamentous hemagglutinin